MSAALLGLLSGVGPGRQIARQAKIDASDAQVRRDDSAIRQEESARRQSELEIKQAEEARRAKLFQQQQALADVFAKREQLDNPEAWMSGQGVLPADGQPATPTPPPSWRDRYNTYSEQASNLIFATGGIDGYQKWMDMENSLNRQQIMGYGIQAANAMNEGNVGEAMRAGNAALEHTPVDTGLKFVVDNGELYLQGADGSVGAPLKRDDLRAFIEQHFATPENYLNLLSQYTAEEQLALDREIRTRAADTADRNADTAALNAGTAVGRLSLEAAALPSQNTLRGAQAVAALKAADADMINAQARFNDAAEGLGWSEENYLAINDRFMDAYNAGELVMSNEWSNAINQQPLALNEVMGAGTNIIKMNRPEDANFHDAAAISQIALAPYFGVNMGDSIDMPTGIQDGQPVVNYNGTVYRVPRYVYDALQQQKEQAGTPPAEPVLRAGQRD